MVYDIRYLSAILKLGIYPLQDIQTNEGLKNDRINVNVVMNMNLSNFSGKNNFAKMFVHIICLFYICTTHMRARDA